jgi:murein DD-endopeptidase MepM/ murein hydrolase activator NlpD
MKPRSWTPLVFLGCGLALREARADYDALVNAFTTLRNDTVFPVPGRGLDDLDSTFGPRMQASTGLYDFHRGIDVDGGSVGDPVGIENVVAVLDGTFYDYRFSASGGNTVILKHAFDTPISYQGKTLTHFYTWYLHLYDDGIANNGIGTADLVSGLNVGDPVDQNTVIGKLGDSGSPSSGTYAPHLHFELRVGSVSSLEFQLDNPGTTQWGFDPHMNPLWLFAPGTYGGVGPNDYRQQLSLAAPVQVGADIAIHYQISNDDHPVWNRFEFAIRQVGSGTVAASHVLDLNQRTGYDASTTASLDSRDLTKPYIDPASGALTGNQFVSGLIVPAAFAQPYLDNGHELVVTARDLWGNTENFTVNLTVVPEPATCAGITGLGLGLFAWWRRR